MYEFNEDMKNKDLTNEQKTREFFKLNLFHKDRIILLAEFFDFVLDH